MSLKHVQTILDRCLFLNDQKLKPKEKMMAILKKLQKIYLR